MSQTVLTRGCKFCESCLHDGWGDGTQEEIEKLSSAVVTEFERRAQEITGDKSIWWQPQTSEVFYECVGQNVDGGHWSDPTTEWKESLDCESLLEEVNQWAMDNMEEILMKE